MGESMRNEELISVIVPVYNVEKYVGKCLDSIINQSYKNLEIIVINDGSKDNSLKIIKEYEKKDNRIIVIDRDNGGLSEARNSGINIANGNYYMFIDSDDFVDEKMIEILYNNLKEYDKKISICNRYYYYENGVKKLRFQNDNLIKNLGKKDSLIDLINCYDFDMSAWAKLYKSELFKQIRFPVGKLSEDYYIMYQLFDLSNGVVYDSRPLLFYLQQRKGSITKNNKIIKDYICASKNQKDYITSHYQDLVKYANSAYCLSYFTVYNKLILNGGVPDREFKIEMKKIVKKYAKYVYRNTYVNCTRKIQIFIYRYFYIFYNFLMILYKKIGE